MDDMVKELSTAFSGRRVLVTGHTGFKGSWLCLWLKELGAIVTGFALPPKQDADHFNLLRLDQMINHIEGDIRDLSHLKKVVDKFQPEFLFHLAAQPLVRYSYQEPKITFDTNVGGSINLLEVIRENESLKSVIYVTSDKCYQNKEWIWGYRENDELGGRDPYSASKAAAELVFLSYYDSYFKEKDGFGIASVRAGNVIGGGDWSQDRIVPDSIKSLYNLNPISIRNPNSTRPWQHVLEPLSGYLMLAAKLYNEPNIYSGSWNFGPRGSSIKSVHYLAEKIISSWGIGELRITVQDGAPHEAGLLQLNCDKAEQILDWHPRWDFNSTVEETVRWYKEVIVEGKLAVEISIRQIRKYMEESHD